MLPSESVKLHGSASFLGRAAGALPLLYAIHLAAATALVSAANRQALLTKEEASSGFVNPAFLEFRLQHHIFGTNFYAYVFFWLTSRLGHSLFYGRYAKAILMSTIPCWIYLYLRKRFQFPAGQAFTAALAISILPGVFCFSWLGVDFGTETAVGFAALWLALFDSRAAIVSSCLLAALSAGCYGGGLVFVAAVAASQLFRLRNPASRWSAIAGLALMPIVVLFPAVWWTNAQTLLAGGAGGPQLSDFGPRLISLARELFVRADSYYFFGTGSPALGAGLIALLAAAGLVFAILDARRTWPLLLVCACSIVLYTLAGNVTGVRRVIPMVITLGIFAVLPLHVLAGSRLPWIRAAAYTVFAVWLAIGAVEWNIVRENLASGRIALPRDFDFRVPPGQTMLSTVSGMLDGSIGIPPDFNGYEPDRTLSILHLMGSSRYSPREIVAACDRHGWSIPSTEPRLERIRRRLFRRSVGISE